MPTKPSKNGASRSRRAKTNPMAAAVQRLYDKSAPLLICEALLFGAAAVLMFFRPMAILTVITYVIGIALVLFGLYRTISGFVVSHNIGGGWLDVIFGLLNIVLGVLFCIYPVGSIVSLAYIFVILFLFKALRALVFAVNMARARFGHYVFNLIMAILLVVVAVALFFFPVATVVALMYYLGVILLLYAISDIYMFFELRRLKHSTLN